MKGDGWLEVEVQTLSERHKRSGGTTVGVHGFSHADASYPRSQISVWKDDEFDTVHSMID